MIDIQELFERQAVWQKSRAKLSWMEKIRMSEVMREAAIAFRKMRETEKARRTEKPE